jgi:hypothetical protein
VPSPRDAASSRKATRFGDPQPSPLHEIEIKTPKDYTRTGDEQTIKDPYLQSGKGAPPENAHGQMHVQAHPAFRN